MRSKLIIAILLFVIVPTAILSFMAARALLNWEIVLEQRMEIDSAATVQSVAGQVNTELKHALDQIITATSGVQARGGMERDISQTASRLVESNPLISQVYVFMNPWDFLYPEKRTTSWDLPATPAASRDLLLAALRRQVASAPTPNAPVRFSIDGSAYLFGLVSMEGLYAGYAVNTDAVQQILKELTKQASGAFVVCAEGPGLFIMPPGHEQPWGEVQVVDSLSESSRFDETEYRVPRLACIAEVRLEKPFEHIRISAFLADRSEVHRTGALRARMYGWAILLLAMGIVAGAGIALHAATNEIRHARARSDFVIGVSHDLRTPLSSMKMLTESLYMDRIEDPGKRQEFLGTVLRECERLNQLIERVLFFVRYGQRALVFHRDYVDVGKLLNEAVDAFIARSGEGGERGECSVFPPSPSGLRRTGSVQCSEGEKGSRSTSNIQHPTSNVQSDPESTNYQINEPSSPQYRTVGDKTRIQITIEPDLPRVRIDHRAMMQVLLNILDNAEKYGRRGADDEPQSANHALRAVDIDVRAALVKTSRWGRERQWVRIAVRDYGMGIESKVVKHVFTPFYRSPRAGDTNVSGVGVGLALCRHVVRAHGGRIEIDSQAGKGSTFYVSLPAERR